MALTFPVQAPCPRGDGFGVPRGQASWWLRRGGRCVPLRAVVVNSEFPTQGTFVKVWKHFRLSRLGEREAARLASGQRQGCCRSL